MRGANNYSVYFKGQLRDGWNIKNASLALTKQGVLPDRKIARFFEKNIKLKGSLTENQAINLAEKFYLCGVVLEVNQMETSSNQQRKNTPQNAKKRPTKRKKPKQELPEITPGFTMTAVSSKKGIVYKVSVLAILILAISVPVLYYYVL